MANSEYNYIPMYIRRTINNRPKDVVTAKYWNELFNLLITQGDHTAEAVANVRGAFRINVTSSNGVYTADKTFDEIKAAYDAGQLPYVVLTGGTLDFVYTLAYFSVPNGTEQDFVDFARYRIEEDTLETEMLRIYSYTTDSGSNIVKRTEEFNVPNGITYIAVNSTSDVISTVNGETYADIQALINAGKPVVVRFDDDLDFYYFETFGFSDSSGTHRRLNFRCVMGSIVYTLTLRDDNTWVISETSLQTSSITDSGGYFTTDTVEGALQELGAGLAGGAVKSVNGKTGVVTLNASDVGAQRPLTAGSGITIIESEDGDIIQSDVSCGDGVVSFVDEAGGASIAQFTLNQTEDCEINVNDLIRTPLLNNYRTAAAQDVIDAGKQDKLIAGEGITIDADGKTISSGGKVLSVNGQIGDVVLDADTVGAQKPLIAGNGITIIPSDNGDIIQSNASGGGGNGVVSFVDNGMSIAQFALNQTQDCEINVDDLNARLHDRVIALEDKLSNDYRTAAKQNDIDNTKLTDAPADDKAYARKNGSWHEITGAAGAVESVNGKTGSVLLNAKDIPTDKAASTTVLNFVIDGAFDEGLVSLTLNGAAVSTNDFISALESGSVVNVRAHDQSNKVVFEDDPVKYKITDDTLSFYFIATTGNTYSPAIYALCGTKGATYVDTLYEHAFMTSIYNELYKTANDLPYQKKMTAEEYLESLEARIAALENS